MLYCRFIMKNMLNMRAGRGGLGLDLDKLDRDDVILNIVRI